MKRRRFLKLSGCASLALFGGRRLLYASVPASHIFCVATSGRDDQPGTVDQPFATLHRAQSAVREFRRSHPQAAVRVMVREGTYYLKHTLLFTPEDSGTAQAPVVYAAWPGEKVTVSGGRRLYCQWQSRKSKSICNLNTGNTGPFAFTQLFVNGKRQVRARFPNYDAADPLKGGFVKAVRTLPPGTSSPNPAVEAAAASHEGVIGIEFDPDTFSQARWRTPSEAVIHIFQRDNLGMLDWQIRSIDYDRNRILFGDGGGQMGDKWAHCSSAVGPGSRFFVDNVLEEMTAPSEWYLAVSSGTLYYREEPGMDMANALIEAPVLDEIIRVQGESGRPAEHISFRGFRFAHTGATYLRLYETVASGRWAFYRGGAVFLEHTRNCAVHDCWFDALGGNALFWSGSNAAGSVMGCRFTDAGENAICFAGLSHEAPDDQGNVPSDCTVVNNLIEGCGVFGKQIAGVCISRSRRITAAHNEFRDLPCAAVCIADGSRSGHLIENNRIAETVRETQHYAPLNAWGTALQPASTETDGQSDTPRAPIPQVPDPELVVLRGNFVRHQTGCAILLDHGARSYQVCNNIADGAAICIGEGGDREIYNNIWYAAQTPVVFAVEKGSFGDRYHHNIAVLASEVAYSLSAPSELIGSLKEIDYNCFFRPGGSFHAAVISLPEEEAFDPPASYTWSDWKKLGFDRNSAWADPLLDDPAKGDFQLREESPACNLGFASFSLSNSGLKDEVAPAWKRS
jgi:hypothetical protein